MAKSQSAGRRVAVVAGSALVGLALLFTVLLVLVDQETVATRVVDAVLPKVSERLGRKITVEGARAKIFPNPQVTLEGFTLHGVGGEPPLVEAAEATVDLALWPLLFSLGQEVEVQSATLVRPELSLLRREDGTWNFEGLGEGAPSSEREVVISRASWVDGVIRIIDRSGSHGEATVALRDVDGSASNIGPGLPMAVRSNAAFASGEQNLTVDLKVSRLPEGKDALAREGWPELEGMLSITHGSLARLTGLLPAKLDALLTSGTFNLDADLTTGPDGAYQVEGTVDLDRLRLRGEPADGGLKLTARLDPNAPGASRVDLEQIALSGPGLDLGGSAQITARPLAVAFALKGQLLDLGTLLDVLPEEEAPRQKTAVLPAKMRRALERVRAEGTLEVAQVRNGALEAQDLEAKAHLEGGVLVLDEGKAGFYGGEVNASGSRVDLTRPLPRWHLRGRLQGVDLARAMADIGGTSPLEGKVDAALDLEGEGADWEAVRKNLTGNGTLAMSQGRLAAADLGGELATQIASGLEALGQGGAANVVEGAEEGTPIRDLRMAFRVDDGAMILREPLGFTSSLGAVALDGRVGLDLTLDLDGRARLSRDFLSRIAPPRVARAGAHDVSFGLGGSLTRPALKEVDPSALAKELLEGEVRRRAKPLEDEVRRQARRRLGGILDRLPGEPP